MSSYTIPLGAREGGNESGPARIPASMLGAIAGVGLLLLLPGQARADRGYSYGHAEISLGFPNGQVTVGRTWEDEPRGVVVEQVTHKFPETDLDEEEHDVEIDEDEDEPDHIIIEKRHRRPRAKQVTIIERYEEPVHCDRVEVVRKVYVERPSYRHHDVVVYQAPQRVIYAPSRTVIYAPGGRGHSHHGGGHKYRGSHNGGGRGYQVHDRGHGPRELFPEGRGRPARERGVRKQLVQVGVNR